MSAVLILNVRIELVYVAVGSYMMLLLLNSGAPLYYR